MRACFDLTQKTQHFLRLVAVQAKLPLIWIQPNGVVAAVTTLTGIPHRNKINVFYFILIIIRIHVIRTSMQQPAAHISNIYDKMTNEQINEEFERSLLVSLLNFILLLKYNY